MITHAIAPPPTFGDALKIWFKIGCVNFGGPAAQIALMHRVVVDEKKWVEEQRYLHALNFCMLLPGPEAQKLATYVGWLLHGVRGGLAAGILFVLPGALVMLAVSLLYFVLVFTFEKFQSGRTLAPLLLACGTPGEEQRSKLRSTSAEQPE